MLLEAKNITKSYTDRILINDQSLTIGDNDKIGIIGTNGCGKSTLLKILAGIEEAEYGSVTVEKNKRINYLSQDLNFDSSLCALDYVLSIYKNDIEKEMNAHEAKSILTKLNIIPEKIINTMSGGEKRKVSIAKSLLIECDLLIIDEITNHLDSETITYLEKYLIKFRGSIIMVTHDRYFLERICNRIVELYRGKLYFYEGNYSKFLELKAQRLEDAKSQERKRQTFLRREYEWIKRGCQARTTKSKDRIENYYKMLNQEGLRVDKKVELSSISQRLGNTTIEAYNINKYNLFNNFSMMLPNDARIGVIGSNGAGKTTLINCLTKTIEVDSGEVIIGETVKIGYFTQENENLPYNKRVYDFIHDISEVIETDSGTISVTQILEKFLFFGESQYSFISKLSGGEKRRLYLLSILISKPNILVLDEPTNDLDIETLEVLEDYLDNFKGAVITISHDRYFLDRCCDLIYHVNNGKIDTYNGNYSFYLEKVSEKETKQAKVKIETKSSEVKVKTKLTYNERKEFETILDVISEIEDKIKELDNYISFNYHKYDLVKDKIEEKEKLEEELLLKMERWEYLSSFEG